MGSQTLEILRQGVWASLTGGWFYDPHQSVFCNVVHLYLWLFLLCSPFVSYLYFPSTWITWFTYCVVTCVTTLVLKLANMGLHRLYDKAQTISENNIKQHFFKVAEDADGKYIDHEGGIEMQVMRGGDLCNTTDQTTNGISAENSIMSIENINGVIDLKVDVHRKNSSESIELMLYAPSMMSENSQNDQQLTGTNNGSKSPSHTITNSLPKNNSITTTAPITSTKYITTYCNDNGSRNNSSPTINNANNSTPQLATRQPRLLRKSSEIIRGHLRRRLERQNSLDAAAESVIIQKLIRKSLDEKDESALGTHNERHEDLVQAQNFTTDSSNLKNNISLTSHNNNNRLVRQQHYQTLSNTTQRVPHTTIATTFIASIGSGTSTISNNNVRLQRHRSSETHDECLKAQQRSKFMCNRLPDTTTSSSTHYHNHNCKHHQLIHIHRRGDSGCSNQVSSSGTLNVDELELGMGSSTKINTLKSWVLGSSSDVFVEDDSYTKSDLDIEQLNCHVISGNSCGSLQLNKQYQQNQTSDHFHSHQQQLFRLRNPHQYGDSRNTKSALQLAVSNPMSLSCRTPLDRNDMNRSSSKKRQGSNITASCKRPVGSNLSTAVDYQDYLGNTVRRIKSTALETSCLRPSVSNLCPHPSSVEAISDQQQLKHPKSDLLLLPSKRSVHNPHLNLCHQFDSSSGGSINDTTTGSVEDERLGNSFTSSSLDFGSTNVLIDSYMTLTNNQSHNTDLIAIKKGYSKYKINSQENNCDKEKQNEKQEQNISLHSPEINNQDGLRTFGDGVTCPPFFKNDNKCQHSKHTGQSTIKNFLHVDVYKGSEKDQNVEIENDGSNIEGEDDDEFKDFDYDVEIVLQNLRQTQNQIDEDVRVQLPFCDVQKASLVSIETSDNKNTNGIKNDTNDNKECNESLCNEERLHSTDSEMENICFRSSVNSSDQVAQPTTCTVFNREKCKKTNDAVLNSEEHTKVGESNSKRLGSDSGCPSSDCEQISASSKDILLPEINCATHKESAKTQSVDNNTTNDLDILSSPNSKNDKKGSIKQNDISNKQIDTVHYRNLGAIPKIAQVQDVNELQFKSKTAGTITKMIKCGTSNEEKCKGKSDREDKSKSSMLTVDQYKPKVDDMEFRSKTATAIVQMHKRNAGNWTTVAICNGSEDTNLIETKVISRNSSPSNSSHSLCSEALTADMRTMLCFMHDESPDKGERHLNKDDNYLTSVPNLPLLPSSAQMINGQFQFYQNTFKTLHTVPSVERFSLNENMHCRERLLRRRDKKDSTNTSHRDNTLDVILPQSNAASTMISSRPSTSLFGIVAERTISSPLSVLNNRNISGTTTVSLQGFFHDVISDEFRTIESNSAHMGSTTMQAGISASHNSTTTGILNVDRHNLENYCDYWRPACILGGENASIPSRSFYKYRLKCWGFSREFKICMDRLDLLALFDRDLCWCHVVLAVLLSTLVAYLGACILQHNYYKDIFAFFFCAVIAGSQYSLLKSVQPDAASPVHGFNKTVAYSRSIYFCLCGSLLLIFKRMHERYNNLKVKGIETPPFLLYGITFSPPELNNFILEGLYIFLLSFPVIFSLGLFPQINTFIMYLMEQVDMHIFGGNAVGSLLGSFLCVCRSLCGISILYGPLHVALTESKGTQNTLFSIFCALLIPIGYHLSRSASDFSNTWTLIKRCIMSTYHDDDDELSNTISIASNQKFSSNTCKQTASLENRGTNETIEMIFLEKNGKPDFQEEKENRAVKTLESEIQNEELSNSQRLNKLKNTSFGNSNSQVLNKSTNKTMTTSNSLCESNQASERQSNKNVTEADKISSTNSTTHPVETSTYTIGPNDLLSPEKLNINRRNCSSTESAESIDPLPKKLQQTVNARLKNDAVVSIFLVVIVFSLHYSTIFTVLQPDLNVILYSFIGSLGFLLHYIIPQMRKHMPWLCFGRPLLKQKEYGRYEVSYAPHIMWFEKFYIYMCTLEKNVLFPLLLISALTADSMIIVRKYGVGWGTLIVAVCGMKFIRNAYSDLTNQYLIVVFTVLFFSIDFAFASETFLIDYFFVSLFFRKFCDFLLKLQFIVTYIAPWQITWGSAFHAFAQPFSVPHSAMLFLQAGVSAILSTPLNPFLGSAIFLTSYVRPIKFWERDYNTRRIDHSNTRLSSQLERDLGADDNNLNSIFYEHLTRSLQHSLCGDLLMGRWGNVNQGDCFVLASDYLNCLVHVIELGNGLCTFQMRGLEFRGTYCQQREVEAITEDVEDNDGCCCCDPGHLPRMLSVNAMFSSRWLAWQVVASQYVVEGYSISDNLASATLQVFEYRKVLITYYIKSIIYYAIKNIKLEEWLTSISIQDALQYTLSRQFVDLDPIFNFNLDEDFDFRAVGITRSSFCYVYLSWINFCYEKRKEAQNIQSSAATQPKPTKIEISGALASTTTTNNNTKTVNTNNSTTASSTPNLSTTQQLRTRSQKYITMMNSEVSVTNNSADNMPISHSLANISLQDSESVPGLGNIPMTRSTKSAPLGCCANNRNDANSSLLHEEHSTESFRNESEKPFTKLKVPSIAKDHSIVSLCLALGLLARRSLATASHSSLTGVEFFLHGLHALFKGDFRITSPRDEWVFADMDLLHAVVAPAVKMALKLQQDHISNPDEFRDPSVLYETIDSCATDLVISHEADPVWRSAVLRGAPNLLALRHVMEDGSDEYRIIRLTKRFLTFRVIKLNRECVRGLWAGQQQELIYLRNRNPERGSIQNAKQALRNIINSSCDQPIGYPIYVSPLTTSYADTNEQLRQIIGGPITPEAIKDNVLKWWHHICQKCRQGCSSGSAMGTTHFGLPTTTCANVGSSGDLQPVYISPPIYNTLTGNNMFARATVATGMPISTLTNQFCNEGLPLTRSNLTGIPHKPNSTTLLASFLSKDQELLRDSRTSNKTRHMSGFRNRSDRERRATLPSTSYTLPGQNKASDESSQNLDKDTSSDSIMVETGGGHKSPRYTKAYSSSGNIGISTIITTPGDYPRKTKGPICLTAATVGLSQASDSSSIPQCITELSSSGKIQIGLFERAIIVDEQEIYDGLDERRDFVWPYEGMRLRGGRINWKGWLPRTGMIGVVVHIWTPNNSAITHRSLINRTLYLLEIADYYVPVTENGVRPFKSLTDNSFKELERSRRNSVQREILELRQLQQQQHNHIMERVLTPILGSSLESPISQLSSGIGYNDGTTETVSKLKTKCDKIKIKAVSSSSSEDESDFITLELQRRENFINMWKQITVSQTVEHANKSRVELEDKTVQNDKDHLEERINNEHCKIANEVCNTLNKSSSTPTPSPPLCNNISNEHEICKQNASDSLTDIVNNNNDTTNLKQKQQIVDDSDV